MYPLQPPSHFTSLAGDDSKEPFNAFEVDLIALKTIPVVGFQIQRRGVS